MDSGAAPSRNPSGKRSAGAALFGFLVASYIQEAAQNIPLILAQTGKTHEAAAAYYESSQWLRLVVIIVTVFAGAAISGFLARRKGVIVGLFANSVYILALAYMLLPSFAVSLWLPDAEEFSAPSFRIQVLTRLVLVLLAASVGGFLGQKLYSPERDLDLNQAKVTVFGVRWAHYFWIVPFIYLGFLESLISIIHGGIVMLVADVSFAWHPSLWLNATWSLFFTLGPSLIALSAWMTGRSFVRFHKVVQYRQTGRPKGWRKFGQVLLYGVGVPAIAYTVAVFGADVARTMPKPLEGDWKVAVGLTTVLLAIGLGNSIFSALKTASSARGMRNAGL